MAAVAAVVTGLRRHKLECGRRGCATKFWQLLPRFRLFELSSCDLPQQNEILPLADTTSLIQFRWKIGTYVPIICRFLSSLTV